MTELITPDVTKSAWFDVVVTSGSPKTLFIKPLVGAGDDTAPAGARFEIAHKTSGGTYCVFDQLTPANINTKGQIQGAGTFGLRRLPCPVAAGMDVEG